MRGFIAFSALYPSMDDDGECARYGEGMAVVAGAWVGYGLGQWASDDGMVQVQAKCNTRNSYMRIKGYFYS